MTVQKPIRQDQRTCPGQDLDEILAKVEARALKKLAIVETTHRSTQPGSGSRISCPVPVRRHLQPSILQPRERGSTRLTNWELAVVHTLVS